ncbi:MAG: 2-succinyl-5-enolpyruvyl-6-hydroxy-3-cyclohexene-1-carboxylic-acid synthase [Beutenbergiaceae bacterium]
MSEYPAALAARELVTALVAQGVRDVVLAPGSRSAPLAYALAAAEAAGWLRVHVRIDERVAGFVALGIARSRPAAVVTTSGTAVANLHPAVLEAHHSRLPLLIISADRPHEMRAVGANQTTDQAALFGTALRYAVDLPASLGSPMGVRSAVVRAVAAATGARGEAGPVQLNAAFREPLVPASTWHPGPTPQPYPRVWPIASDPRMLELSGPQRTVVIAGDQASQAAADLAESAGWPLLAEPSSGVRASHAAIAGYRQALSHLGPQIQRVVVFGRPTLSRDISALLARTDIDLIIVAPHDWTDVAGVAGTVVGGVSWTDGRTDPHWPDLWRQHQYVPSAQLTGAAVARALLAASQTHAVVLGSSLTIRQADDAAPAGADFTRAAVIANRGLAGIDGTIASASGVALATDAPVRAMVGDLTFMHDIGALLRGVHEREVNLQVFVINNHGGGIFATLEHGQGEHAPILDRYFGTPQQADLQSLARGSGASYQRLSTPADLAALMARPVIGRSVVEVDLSQSS